MFFSLLDQINWKIFTRMCVEVARFFVTVVFVFVCWRGEQTLKGGLDLGLIYSFLVFWSSRGSKQKTEINGND